MRPLWLLLALGAPAALAQPAAPTAPAAQAQVSQAQADVDTLASPAYAGRGYARGGAAKAEAYVERRFREIGLEPAFPDGFRQPFTFEKDLITDTPRLEADGDALTLGDGFYPYASSGSGKGRNVPVVDVGHGLLLRPLGINAYEGKEAEMSGKVALVSAPVPDSLRRMNEVPAAMLSKEARIYLAEARGASAVLFLEDAPLFGSSGVDAPLPAFDLVRSAWSGAERVSFRVEALHDATVEAANLAGLVRGTAEPDSVLLVTAHLDGLGALGPDAYFPGANDNASGVAMLLALAKAIHDRPLRYTVVFAALGGEESGLKGAFHLADHPPVPLDRVRFLVNFDMVASAEDGVLVFGGRDVPAEYALLEAINEDQGGGPLAARGNRANSDHWAFTERGVPGFYLLTKDGTQPYHSLRDVPETLEWDDFARAFRLAEAFLRAL